MRIISLSPTATEWILKIGGESEVVAFTGYPGCLNIPGVTMPGTENTDLCTGRADRYSPGFFDSLFKKSPDVVFVDEALETSGDGAELEDLVKRSGVPLYRVRSRTFKHILDAGLTIGKAIGHLQQAMRFLATSERQLNLILAHVGVRKGVQDPGRRSVLFLRSLDPPVIAGCWVPDLIEIAGAEPLIVHPGDPSREVSWQEITAARPDLVVLACPGKTQRSVTRMLKSEMVAGLSERVLVSGESLLYYTPGPNLYDAIEAFLFMLHPERLRGMVNP